MLDNHYTMKETELKAVILENRLKRLTDEQEKAKKNQALAERKAKQLLESRTRHYSEMMAKIKRYQDQNTLLEFQRMKN